MKYGVTYNINIEGGNVVMNTFNQMNGSINNVTKSMEGLKNTFKKIGDHALAFNQIKMGLEGLGQMLRNTIAPGIALDASLKDLSAIAGVTGSGLKEIENNARATAQAFGIEASGAVESYKLILSQLGPDLAQNGSAMKVMGDHIATLSKTMGGDAAAAAGVLTTAMNQYRIDTSDASAAAKTMGEMMNVMSAAAKEGSAELPQINAALQKSGMTASAAGVSFEELNAAIQVLDKAGKKGAEGGVAIQNVIQQMGKGRFVTKEVKAELARYGISVDAIADKNKTLAERLRILAPLKKDTALLSQMFGTANSAAALALLQGVDAVEDYTQKITGTNTAVDQAGVIMDGYSEKLGRVNAWFDDLKISLFNTTKSFMPYVEGIGKGVKEAGLFAGSLFTMKKALGEMQWGKMIRAIKSWHIGTKIGAVTTAIWGGVMKAAGKVSFKNLLQQFRFVSLRTNIATAATAVWGLVTKGIIHGVMIPSLKALSRAIYSIPIIGWIAGGIAALIGLGTYLWNTSKKFREVLFGIWGVIKWVFNKAWGIVKGVFGKIFNIYKTVFGGIWDGIMWIWEKMKGFFGWIGDIFAGVFKPVLGFLNDWVLQPFLKVFGNVWDFIKKVFGWIGDKLSFIFKPIWALIKKLFGGEGGVTEAYKEGAEKGGKSWDDSHKKEDGETSLSSILGGGKGIGTEAVAAGKVELNPTADSKGKSSSGGGSGIKKIDIRTNSFIGVINIINNNLKDTGDAVKKHLEAVVTQAVNDAQLNM